MKLFSAIAAAAVVGASFIAPNPADASMVENLDTGVTTLTNDGIPREVLVRDGYVIYRHVEHDAYPIDSDDVEGGLPKKGGFWGIGGVENKNVYATYTTPSNLVTTGNRIMSSKLRNGPGSFTHWSTPKKITSSPMMFSIRSAKDQVEFIKVKLTKEDLKIRQGH